jgi:hypothetical protein
VPGGCARQGEEPFYRPPAHELRHPLIFYYGHPAVLYVNKLRVAGILTEQVIKLVPLSNPSSISDNVLTPAFSDRPVP